MLPEEAIERREARIDALIDKVEEGYVPTRADWRQLYVLNELDLMSVSQGAARETLEMEREADRVFVDGVSQSTANP